MSEPVASTLFVGIGSPHGNDRVGWFAAQELVQRSHESQTHVEVRCAQVPADLLDWIPGRERLVLCDACRLEGEPGTIHRWKWPDSVLLNSVSGGSHGWNLCAALQLAERLQILPSSVVIWGMEIGNVPSPVTMSVDDSLIGKVSILVSRILEEIRHA